MKTYQMVMRDIARYFLIAFIIQRFGKFLYLGFLNFNGWLKTDTKDLIFQKATLTVESVGAKIIFSPIIETAIFQLLIISLGERLGLNKKITFSVSVLCFSGAHFFVGGWYLVFTGFILGVVFAIAFYKYMNLYDYKTAFVFVSLMHMIYNFVSFFI